MITPQSHTPTEAVAIMTGATTLQRLTQPLTVVTYDLISSLGTGSCVTSVVVQLFSVVGDAEVPAEPAWVSACG